MNKPATTSQLTGNYQILSLWQFLRGFYKLRNSVAHSGVFNVSLSNLENEDEKYASKLLGIHYPHKYDLSSFVKSVIDKNIDKIK